MSLETDVTILRHLPIFGAFNDEQLRLVAFAAEPLNVAAGTVLFEEGDPASEALLVVSGAVRLSVAGEEGPMEKALVGPGALIGEMALLASTTRPARAEAIEPSSLRVIPRRALHRVLDEYPHLATSMRKMLAHRLTTMTGKLEHTRRAMLAMEPEGE